MEKYQAPGIEMKNVFQLLLLTVCLLNSCDQPVTTVKSHGDSGQRKENTIVFQNKIPLNSSTIAILSNKEIEFFSLRDSLPATLTQKDMEQIEVLLLDCIHRYNKNTDSSKIYAQYIRQDQYNRQYVPYTGINGEKKVFINCFCSGINGFNYWREKLVEVEDGGSCFFNTTINLGTGTFGPLLINGPG